MKAKRPLLGKIQFNSFGLFDLPSSLSANPQIPKMLFQIPFPFAFPSTLGRQTADQRTQKAPTFTQKNVNSVPCFTSLSKSINVNRILI